MFFFKGKRSFSRNSVSQSQLRFEALEDRQLLSADGAFGLLATTAAADPSALIVTTGEDVTDASDDVVSLREAVTAAIANAKAGETDPALTTVTFASGVAEVNLTEGEIVVNANISIDGSVNSEAGVTIDANGSAATDTTEAHESRIFQISSGTLTVNDLTFTGGYLDALTKTQSGGAITVANSAKFDGTNVHFVDNSLGFHISETATTGLYYAYGGAIYNRGTVTISGDSSFENNSIQRYNKDSELSQGGAIYNQGTLNINGAVSFTGNTAGRAGAIYCASSSKLFINGDGTDTGTPTFTANDSYYGGVIYAGMSSTIAINGAAFDSNEALIDVYEVTSSSGNTSLRSSAGHGGVIYLAARAKLTIGSDDPDVSQTTAFANNKGMEGGALFASSNASIKVNDGVFANNAAFDSPHVATNAGYGGGVYLSRNSVLDVTGGSFSGNSAGNCGGAVYSMGTVTAVDVDFVGNITGYRGGAIHSEGSSSVSSTLTVVGGSFESNQGSAGGAISSYLTVNASITGTADSPVIFANNVSTAGGGAFWGAGSTSSATAHPVFTANYVAFNNNSAVKTGGAFDISKATEVELSNTTFDGNSAGCGGAIYSVGQKSAQCAVTINGDSYFKSNTATVETGGAIHNVNSVLTVQGADNTKIEFTQNTSADSGGAVYNKGTANVENVEFELNSSETDGGAIYNSGTFVIDGTLTFNKNEAGRSGGAVYNSSSLEFTGEAATRTFTDNKADLGGAVYNESDTALVIADSVFTDNEATTAGGAIYNKAGEISVVNIPFTNNLAVSGGAIYNSSTTGSVVDGSSFTNNSAQDGGAVYNSGVFTVSDSTFERNVANGGSGGAAGNAYGATLLIDGATFNGNTANDANGGALYNGGAVTVDNSNFTNNKASKGGAVYSAGSTRVKTATADLTSVNLSRNEAARSGGSVFNDQYSTLTVIDGTFSRNVAEKYGGAFYNKGVASVSGTGEVFSQNDASFGGAIYNKGSFAVTGTDANNQIAFKKNSAVGDASGSYLVGGSGGAIYCSSAADVTVENALFYMNEADKLGGAISSFGALSVSNSLFDVNVAGSGAAIQSAGTAAIADSTFTNNVAAMRSLPFAEGGSDKGGNGGAVFVSKNASAPSAEANCVFTGENTFRANSADNAGGAVDFISGSMSFGSADMAADMKFVTNSAKVVGGAFVVGGESPTNENNSTVTLTGNTSGFYGRTIAANCQFRSNAASDIKEAFGLITAEQRGTEAEYSIPRTVFDTFARYKNVSTADMTLDYSFFAERSNDEPGTIVVVYDGKSVELSPGGSVSLSDDFNITAEGVYELNYYVKEASDTLFGMWITVENSRCLIARPLDLNDIGLSEGVVGYSFRYYESIPISEWTVNWGDGSDSETTKELSYYLNTYHWYDNPGVYEISLSVKYANGSTYDFGKVAQYEFKAGETTSEASSALSESEVFLTDELFSDEDSVLSFFE